MISSIIEGSFLVQVFRHDQEIITLPRTKNLITRGGMDAIEILGNNLHIGTGGTTPVFADTSLQSFIATKTGANWSANTSVLTGDDYVKESKNTFTFAIGAVVGNISELGISTTSNETSDIQTRALFKDGAGDPTTITVTSQDQLVVTYFVKKTISMVPFVSSISATVDGSPVIIDYTVRPCISSSSDSGSGAEYTASTYQIISASRLYMTVNNANRISVAPVTFIPTLIDSGGDTLLSSSTNIALTASGSIVTHNFTYPLGSGNLQWVSATIGSNASPAIQFVLFQIEFNGPNFITKTNTDSTVFTVTETMNQVIV